ncbi:Beta-glucan synthesis-associated protein skn1, partial [Globisporangium polare]
YWGGPRCTYQLEETSSNGSVALSSYGPPLYAAAICAGIAVVATVVVIVLFARKRRAQLNAKLEKAAEERVRELRDAPDEPQTQLHNKSALSLLDYDDEKGLDTNKSLSSYSLLSGV